MPSVTRTVFASRARTLRILVLYGSSSSCSGDLSLARYVNTKSEAVTGTPSLHRASGRMKYVSVNGGFVVTSTCDTSFGCHELSGPSNAPSTTP